MKTYIYTLSCPDGNIRYVGKSIDPKRRLNEHIKNYNKSISYKNNWIKSLIEKGEYPIISIIDEVEYEDSSFFEIFWICQIKSWGFNLTNLTLGGEGTIGYKFTFEQIQKMKKPKSIEHKIKIRNTQIGRKLNDDWKNNIKKGCKNSKKVLDANRKIGKDKEIEVYQYDKFNLLINKFQSIKDAFEITGINHISECINGKRKMSNGFFWSKHLLTEKEFILKDVKILINNRNEKISFEFIENIICDYFKVSKEDVRKISTNKNIPKIYLTWMLFNLIDDISLSDIDKYLGSTGSKFRIKNKYNTQTLIDIGNKMKCVLI
jgi:hypothetical protein